MARSPVTLKVDGFKDRQVDAIEYTFTQAIDKEGQTTGLPRGGLIKLTVKALNDGNCELFNWMCNSALALNGKIEFMRSDDQGIKMKDIRFLGAYCVGYTEHWENPGNSKNSLTHWENIVITCKEIINQAVMWNNEWL